jgi:hypothetical protein
MLLNCCLFSSLSKALVSVGAKACQPFRLRAPFLYAAARQGSFVNRAFSALLTDL